MSVLSIEAGRRTLYSFLRWAGTAILIACIFVPVLTLSGCKRSDPPAAQIPQSTPVKVESTAPVTPPLDHHAVLDPYIQKRVVVRQQLAGLMKQSPRDIDAIKDLLLQRKGEILSTQKQVRQLSALSPAEKDSLLNILDAESVEISTRLVSLHQ
jgi:hypothetical protein